MKKLPIWIILMLAVVQGVRGQESATDSLRSVVANVESDSVRLGALLELSQLTFRSEPNTAIAYAEEARRLAANLNDQTSLAYALKNIGLAYYIKGDYFEVLEYWQQSLEIFEKIEDRLGVSNLTNNIGAVYFNQGDDPTALDYYLQSLRVSEQIGDSLRIATALTNLGAVYYNKQETADKALDYYLRALAISENLRNPDAIGTSAVNLGEIYLEQGDLESALVYFNKALTAYGRSGGNQSAALHFLGKTYAARGEYAAALGYHQRAYQMAARKDARLEMATALVGTGQTLLLDDQPSRAVETLQRAISIAEEVGALALMEEAYEGLTAAYRRQDNFREAFASQTLLTGIRDSLYTVEKDQRLQGLEFQFEIEKKENEIAILNKDNALKAAQIQSASTQRNFLFAAAIFLIISIGGISYQYWFAKKSNRIISEERNRSERILLNILPVDTAQELKQNGFVQAKRFEQATVLFTDFKKFTEYAELYSAEDLVSSIDYYFRRFDEITDRHGLEKIKTIGDSYMCAGGLPVTNTTHPYDTVAAGLEMVEVVNRIQEDAPEGIIPFDVRIGVSTGPVVAGVVGTRKFQYDIWGKTVNTASRMESSSDAGRVNISAFTYELIKDRFACTFRGKIMAKHGKLLRMYYVDAPIDAASAESLETSRVNG